MGITHFIKALPDRGVRESSYILGEFVMRQLPMPGWGEPVYERDWDVLVVLDACRADLFAEVALKYSWLDPEAVDVVDSVAGSSKEWMERTFVDEYRDDLAATAYVTGNPFTAQVFDDGHPFGRLDEVWQYAWDDDIGTIHPGPLTDRAILTGRDDDFDRLIVHYMQPHVPFISDPELHRGYQPDNWGSAHTIVDDETEIDIWGRIRRGEIDRERAWTAYADNLRTALESVDRLRTNIDADRMILTADHGNALGERLIWGHKDVPVAGIRKVPWAVVDAADTGSSTPDDPAPAPNEVTAGADTPTAGVVEDRLAALGYK